MNRNFHLILNLQTDNNLYILLRPANSKKNLKLSSLIIFFEQSFLFIDPSVSNKKFFPSPSWKRLFPLANMQVHTCVTLFILATTLTHAHSERIQLKGNLLFTELGGQSLNQEYVIFVRSLNTSDFEATCNLLETIDWPLSQFLWSSANNPWVGSEQNEKISQWF